MKKQNAASVDQTESGGGQVVLEGFDASVGETEVDFKPEPESIAFFLCRGHENAVTTRELARITGEQPRTITRAIQEERLRGAPILSGRCGYWLPEDADEVRACVRGLFRRISEQRKTALALLGFIGRRAAK